MWSKDATSYLIASQDGVGENYTVCCTMLSRNIKWHHYAIVAVEKLFNAQ